METFNCPLLIFKIIILFLYRDKNISVNDSLLVQGFNSEYQFGSIEPDDRLIEADIVLEHVAEISSLHVLQYKNQEVLMRETVNGFRHKVAFHLAKKPTVPLSGSKCNSGHRFGSNLLLSLRKNRPMISSALCKRRRRLLYPETLSN